MPSYACSSLCSSISPYHTIQFSLPKILRLTFPSPNYLLQTNTIFPFPRTQIPTTAFFTPQSPFMKKIHTSFSSLDDRIDKIAKTEVSAKHERTNSRETELELLGKPSPIPVDTSVKEEVSQSPKPEIDEALAPFLKFFKPRDSSREEEREFNADDGLSTSKDGAKEGELDSERRVNVEYYEPKPGDLVVGVVVSGNENKLDVNVGADLLGTMLTKEVLPLHNEEISNLCCDLEKDAEKFMVAGKIGIVKDEEALSRVESVSGRPVVEVGTVLFAEVLGRTLSGRPLLSSRRMFRRVAWHRVRQIKQLNEPIEVTISEWNTGGLLTRIEGLRAFLPKAELMNRAKNFTTLKENIGRQICVLITRIDEASNGLIISERDAWEMLHLREGTLLEGTIRKIFTYGAQVRIGDTNRSGLLHISNMSQSRVTSVSDLLKEGEKVKVLVMKPMFADKISLSIAALESEPGLFLSNKEKVFSEAEEMAKKYRQKLPAVTVTHKLEELPNNVLPFDDEASSYANWEWFKFEQDDKPFGP